MNLTMEIAREMTGGKPGEANLNSVVVAVNKYGARFKIDQPHILAMFISQIGHESQSFKWDSENLNYSSSALLRVFRKYFDAKSAKLYARKPKKIANRVYANRMGNGDEASGDGSRYAGKTAMQTTGKNNHRKFGEWCRTFNPGAPDFVMHPELMITDPWEGLSPIWYWTVNDLNNYADEGNHEMVTRRINGGLNGYDDRLKRYDRAALVLLGYGAKGLRLFQEAENLVVDGISGPATRGMMHLALVDLSRPKIAAVATAVGPLPIDATFLDESDAGVALCHPKSKPRWAAMFAATAALFRGLKK